MYLPRNLISHLYNHLLRTHHQHSPPVLILVALEPDALCACRILTALLKRDYIQHKIQPISGYGDLARAGEDLVQPMRTTDGGSGGAVVCLGVGGLVDLEAMLGLEIDENGQGGMGGVDIWVVDARRPWNLANVFGEQSLPQMDPTQSDLAARKSSGVEKGKISQSYRPGKGGIIVFDDGDVEEELGGEREAWWALAQMPEVEEEDGDSDGSDSEQEDGQEDKDAPTSGQPTKKRKSPSDRDDETQSEDEDDRPRQRRRGNSHDAVLRSYYELGHSYSEPISSLMYSLASELGREDNDLLWHAIVGVGSLELYGRTMRGVGLSPLSSAGGSSGWNGDRGERIRAILRDEVRRLNPTDLKDIAREAMQGEAGGVIPTHARSPTDMSIRLSPEPRFLLVRHWSLYDSMLHSPYLSAKLHIWSDNGRRRLHKLLAKMGVSLSQCKQSYTHMDMDLKRGLRERLLKFAPVYGLDGLACLSALDVGVVLGAILEVGSNHDTKANAVIDRRTGTITPAGSDGPEEQESGHEEMVQRFWTAYDALASIDRLTAHIPTAQSLHRAILRTGTSLIEKKQIRHLRAFRMAVVKEGPDVQLFTHAGALVKLALWIGEAIGEMEGVKGRRRGGELVLAGLDEARGCYVVVGLGGGGGMVNTEREKRRAERKKEKGERKEEKRKQREERRRLHRERQAANGELDDEDEEEDDTEEESSDSSESEDEAEEKKGRGYGRNRFGLAFHEVIEETGAKVKVDSFEHCVVEVGKEDLTSFLEALSLKAVVG
ncbi:DNA replication initiation factor cdc45 [Coniosporium tulheliwenetii]|uniref:DNA replication initiation factor cdc45 n=1 Tax=Coniosporium tulheliwenetii TaxID=3383036 RepID=A0ACC2Z0A1_9PEZI|nr:DNA replication initiation factor cdc45 [Cladosporium sp. JES 115]